MEPIILLLSKSDEIRQHIESVLASSPVGFHLIGAQKTEQLEELLSNHQLSLVLIDQEFEGENLLVLLNTLNTNPKIAGVSLILLVSNFEKSQLGSLLNFGIEDFIMLPLNSEQFLLRIELGVERTKWVSKLLQQSEQFGYITQAASMAGNSLVIIDRDGEMIWANDGFEKLYGCNLDEFKVSFGNNLFESNMKQVTRNAMQRCRDNGEYVVYDSLWITPSNERKFIQTSLTPIYDPNGNFNKIIAIETDITELKRTEEELIEKNDHLLSIAEHLEKANELLDDQRNQIESQKASLEEEMQKSENLLHAILPATTAHQLKKKGFVKPKKFKEASVMFADFVGFSRISSMYEEIEDLLDVLGFYFEKFDEITTQHYLEKIKTIGDCYMCVGGVPQTNKSHPFDAVIAALKMQKFVEEQAIKCQDDGRPVWRIRIGIHTGPLAGGVIGKKRFAYDIWGDTVNLASRMETASDPGMVNVSQATHEYIKNYIDCNYRGKFPAKNIGEIDMFYVQRIKPEYSEDDEGYIPNAELRKIIAAF